MSETKTPKDPRHDWDGLMHDGNWRKWLGHLIGTRCDGLEVGTFYGESAEWMLDNIFTSPGAIYHCVDTFKGSVEHQLGGQDCSTLEATARARLARFGTRVEFHVGQSHEVLRGMHGEFLDFILIDGAHDAMNVLRDGILAFDLLKAGGVMIFDDVAWSIMPAAVDCPRIAIEAFVECYGRQLEVLGFGTQAAVRKIK